MAEATNEWRRTSPVAVVFYVFSFLRRLVTDGLPALAPLTAAFVASENLLWSWFGLAALVGGALLLAWAFLSWLRFRFRLSDGVVEVRRGVLLRQQLSIDFDRVQNVNIREPFYMRPLRLASLGIDTAGSSGKEVTVAGIPRSLAVALRRDMLAVPTAEGVVETVSENGESQPVPVDAPDATEADETDVLLRHNARAITIYGLTASSLLWVAVLLGFVLSSADSLGDAFSDQLGNLARSAVMNASRFGIDEAITIGLMVVGVILLLPLASVAGAFFRYHDFVLSYDGEAYRRIAGLLNRHDESVKRHKIQEVVWKQNFLARWFRRLHLKVNVAQAGQAAEASQAGLPIPGMNFLVPSLTLEQARWLTGHMVEGAPESEIDFSSVNRSLYLRRYLLYGWTAPVVLASIAPILLGGVGFALLIPAGLGLGALILNQLWRRLGYAVVGEVGVVRTGFLGSKTMLFPLYKVQRVDLRQTPGQRRHGVAHLAIHLASGTMTLPYIRIEDAERFRDIALYHAESDPRPWF